MHPVWRDFVALFCGCVVLVPLRVCLACVEFLQVLLGFFCCLLFSSKIPTLFPPQFTSLSHNALPHTPSRISSKSFSKIQESPASASSSLLAGAKHDPGDKVDDGCSWLVWVQLSKEVADVVCGAPLLPGHKAEEPVWGKGKSLNKVCQYSSRKDYYHPLPAWSCPSSLLSHAPLTTQRDTSQTSLHEGPSPLPFSLKARFQSFLDQTTLALNISATLPKSVPKKGPSR